MPLKIELKPGERLIVGNALITNDNERVKLFIEGNVPILREKSVLPCCTTIRCLTSAPSIRL